LFAGNPDSRLALVIQHRSLGTYSAANPAVDTAQRINMVSFLALPADGIHWT